MPLVLGTKLGPYEVVGPLGVGGMGEVYRARDARLGREVAIKILPAELSKDVLRKQRFEREARTISSLNHPHICVLHDVGHQDGIDYLVMECVEGETLAKRLEKGPLPLEQVLKYGAQIADALDKAHRAGIVHRDLKPGNIMLTASGAKLLDFGLAKPAVTLATAATLTVTTPSSPVTEQGTIVGTFQYMSPEQVEGKELDGRSDIFSLGAVLFEMVTGHRAFEGKSQLSVASAILEKEPAPISTIKPMTPPGLDHIVKKCLAKEPSERWQSASDLASELKWVGEGSSQAGMPAPVVGRGQKRERLAWALAAVSVAGLLAGLVAYLRVANFPAHLMVADVAPPKGAKFNFLATGAPALAPDGHAVVFGARDVSGKTLLWVRPLDSSSAYPLIGTEDSGTPFWSPDSRKIGFVTHYQLKNIEASGGHPAIVSETASLGGGGTWSREGTLLVASFGGIYRVPAAGGAMSPVIRVDRASWVSVFAPRFLPDGKHFLYQAASPGSPRDTYFASLDGKENRLVVRDSGRAAYCSGFLLYSRGETLMAQPFDPDKGQLTGTGLPIAELVGRGAFYSQFDVSENGVLVYEPAASGAQTVAQLAWLDRSGKRLAFIGEPGNHYDVRLAPDTRRLASGVGDPISELWEEDLVRGVRMRLTFDPETDKGIPVWSPDGSHILYSTLRDGKAGVGIYEKAANGAGGDELLLASDRSDREVWATDWSRDGRFVLYSRGDLANNSEADIWVLPMVGARRPSLFLHAAAAAYDGQFSPDGRWVAYTSRESGRQEVYVAPFDAVKFLKGTNTGDSPPAGKWLISSDGGAAPRWRGDGKELYYIGPGNTMMAVGVQGKGTGFEVGLSQALFVAPVSLTAATFDVTPDGKRFVMTVIPEEENLPLTVMFNWMTKLKR